MEDEGSGSSPNFIRLAANIVSIYVANNSVPAAELSGLIANVHAALVGLGEGAVATAAAMPTADKPSAAQIRKSIKPDGLISFIDGKSYKTLKRHLSRHGLDPLGYRERFGLPADYPMVASNYAARRSELAKRLGLGRLAAVADEVQEDGARRRKAA